MEIRNVVNEVKNEYPKMEEISKRHLSNSIPKKWLKVGLSSLGIAIISKYNVLASTVTVDGYTIPNVTIAGDMAVPTPLPVIICNSVCPTVQIISAVVFIISGLGILITKIKAKKQNESKKVKKWIKILFIISIIVFILSILTQFIINNID